MRYKIIWSAFSEKQIDYIFEYYTKNANLVVAKKVVKSIISATTILSTNPKTGAKEPLLKNRKIEYRYLVTTNYKLIYSIDEANRFIKISDVFDVRQNPIKLKRQK